MSLQKCPICQGCGLVPPNFYNVTYGHIDNYTSANSNEQCRTCLGTGTIFGDNSENYILTDAKLDEIIRILKDILNHQERHV